MLEMLRHIMFEGLQIVVRLGKKKFSRVYHLYTVYIRKTEGTGKFLDRQSIETKA